MRLLKGQQNNLPIPAWRSDCLTVAVCSACHQCEGRENTEYISEIGRFQQAKKSRRFLSKYLTQK